MMAAVTTTTVLVAAGAALATLVLVLLVLLVRSRRSSRGSETQLVDLVSEMNERMESMVRELAGSIDLDEVLSRTIEAAGAVPGVDAVLVSITSDENRPLIATLGLSSEE